MNHIIIVCIVKNQGLLKKIKLYKVGLALCLVQINGGRERGKCA